MDFNLLLIQECSNLKCDRDLFFNLSRTKDRGNAEELISANVYFSKLACECNHYIHSDHVELVRPAGQFDI